MSGHRATLRFLYDLQLFGIKVGLHNIKLLLHVLGNPERRFPAVHIAGTNGKGSTAAMVASVLCASGYRTGLYTSPHLVDFSERIRVNGKKISGEEIAHYTDELKATITRSKATFFEVTTAIAFQHFADSKVDIAVIETGLGGRLDATNVIIPLLSVITNVGLEHTEQLGRTISRIAYEKGGIIKPGIPCITGTADAGAFGVLKRIASARKSKFLRADKMSSVKVVGRSLHGIQVHMETEHDTYKDLVISLAGDHQSWNARLGVAVVEHLNHVDGFSKISKLSISRALQAIYGYSGLRGRIDLLRTKPLIIADVAHNPAGMQTLVGSLENLLVGKWITIFGVMKDKDYRSMLKVLKPRSRIVVAVRPTTPRALESHAIVEILHGDRCKALDGRTVQHGLGIARDEVRDNECILVTGSHYVVGEALNFLNIKV